MNNELVTRLRIRAIIEKCTVAELIHRYIIAGLGEPTEYEKVFLVAATRPASDKNPSAGRPVSEARRLPAA